MLEVMKLKTLFESLTDLTFTINRFTNVKGDEIKFMVLSGDVSSRNLYGAQVEFMAKASHPAAAEVMIQQVIDRLNGLTNVMFDEGRLQLVVAKSDLMFPFFEGELESNEFMYSTTIQIRVFNVGGETHG